MNWYKRDKGPADDLLQLFSQRLGQHADAMGDHAGGELCRELAGDDGVTLRDECGSAYPCKLDDAVRTALRRVHDLVGELPESDAAVLDALDALLDDGCRQLDEQVAMNVQAIRLDLLTNLEVRLRQGAGLEAVRRERAGEVWVWVGDDDDLDSLTCPVLIGADQLRSLLPQQCEHDSATRYVGCGGRGYWICDACEQVVRREDDANLQRGIHQALQLLEHRLRLEDGADLGDYGDLAPVLDEVRGLLLGEVPAELPVRGEDLVAVATRERGAAHYDTLVPIRCGVSVARKVWSHPAGSCQDPERCDCVCPHCISEWKRAGRPGVPKDGWTEALSGGALARTNVRVECELGNTGMPLVNGQEITTGHCLRCGVREDLHRRPLDAHPHGACRTFVRHAYQPTGVLTDGGAS